MDDPTPGGDRHRNDGMHKARNDDCQVTSEKAKRNRRGNDRAGGMSTVTESEDSDRCSHEASQVGLRGDGDKQTKKRNRGKRNYKDNKITPQQNEGFFTPDDDKVDKDLSARFDVQKQKQYQNK